MVGVCFDLQFLFHLVQPSLVYFFEVIAEVASRTECRLAHRTAVVLDTTVLLKMTKVNFSPCFGESFAALLASVGHLLLRCVDVPVVFDEGGLRAEALAAIFALIRLLTRVHALVDVEEGDVWEPLGTVVALVVECLRRLVCSFVCFQRCG